MAESGLISTGVATLRAFGHDFLAHAASVASNIRDAYGYARDVWTLSAPAREALMEDTEDFIEVYGPEIVGAH
jgi:hypothetical protein